MIWLLTVIPKCNELPPPPHQATKFYVAESCTSISYFKKVCIFVPYRVRLSGSSRESSWPPVKSGSVSLSRTISSFNFRHCLRFNIGSNLDWWADWKNEFRRLWFSYGLSIRHYPLDLFMNRWVIMKHNGKEIGTHCLWSINTKKKRITWWGDAWMENFWIFYVDLANPANELFMLHDLTEKYQNSAKPA